MWRSNNTIKNMKTGLLSNKMYTSKKEEDVLSEETNKKDGS
jgi:predicted lipoprotein